MRALMVAAGAALTLAACSSGNEAQDDNTLAVENLEVGNIIVNDTGAVNGATLEANGLDPNTANAVAQDLTTNHVDTNLANGL